MWRPACLLLLVIACQAAPPPEAGDSATADPATVAGDPRDQLLLASARIALPPEGVAPGDLPDSASAGAALLVTHCAQCHALPSPKMHSATDWPRVARRMWLRMDRLPGDLALAVPDEGARASMLAYLTANALPVSTATLPAGRGREEFAMICGRCHDLPDPMVHSPQDWLAVYLRMERNMERMNVSPATQAQTSAILAYLEGVSGAAR